MSDRLTQKEFMKQSKIVKRYSNRAGRKFARVAINGWSKDILTRVNRDDSEVTQTATIKSWAWEDYQKDSGMAITDVALSRMVDDALPGIDSKIAAQIDELAKAIRDKCQVIVDDQQKIVRDFSARLNNTKNEAGGTANE